MRLRVYRSLKFYMFQRISNENWNLISRSSVVLKINPRGFENWRGITRTGLSWNAIIDWTCRRGFYGAWCIKGWKSDYRPVRYRNGSIVRPVSLSKWAQQLTFPRLMPQFFTRELVGRSSNRTSQDQELIYSMKGTVLECRESATTYQMNLKYQ